MIFWQETRAGNAAARLAQKKETVRRPNADLMPQKNFS